MASRYYPVAKAPNVRVHGPARGAWAKNGIQGFSWNPAQWTYRLQPSKTDTSTVATLTQSTNQQGNFDWYFLRWMTPPLGAQTIAGTFDMCFGVQAVWHDLALGDTDQSVVRFKTHIYIAVGQSTTVRHTLLDNYVDTVDFPGTTGLVWRQLAAAQALASGAALAGDAVMIEFGFRVVSSPTPAVTYPPSQATRLVFRNVGANPAFADAINGDTNTSRAPWMEFSQTLTEEAAPAPPANDACADAIVIPAALPYQSAEIDTTGSTDANRAAWWTWTAPTSGRVILHARGSNYQCQINVFTGGCAVLSNVPSASDVNTMWAHRSGSSTKFDAVAGTQYWIRVRNLTTANNAANAGGLLRFGAFYRQAPATDDLYLPAADVVALRGDQLVNLSNGWISSAPTGVAIDYTRRSMADLNGGFHTGERLLLGLHGFDLVEILDLLTLNTDNTEVDFIGNPWSVPGVSIHPATLHCTAAGFLHVGWFGNGYLYVVGLGSVSSGAPAILNAVSNIASYSALKSINAINADNQPGAPFVDTERTLTIEHTAPWAISLDEATGWLYYTSSGVYEPVGGSTDEVRRHNLTTGINELFATITLQGTNNPGLKGLQFLPGGGLLVCNGTVVHRLNAAGAVIQTYTPSIAEDSQSLIDVKLTANGLEFWTVDLATTRLFKFNIASGAELLTVQPYLITGALTQMAIYQPSISVPGISGPSIEEPMCEDCKEYTRKELIDQVQHYLGDDTGRVWTEAEVLEYLLNGYKELAQATRAMWDQTYLPDFPYSFSCNQPWEEDYLDPGMLRFGVANFTFQDEFDLFYSVISHNAGLPRQSSWLGPGAHTCPDELNYGHFAAVPAINLRIPAAVELPNYLTDLERGTWDNRGIDALEPWHLSHEFHRYEVTRGEVFGYTWKKDGLRRFRKIRIPARVGSSVQTEGQWGIPRTLGAQFNYTVTGTFGVLRQTPNHHPIGWFHFGSPRRFYLDTLNTRIENFRFGRPLDTPDTKVELPGRYAMYLRHYCLARCWGRQGVGHDPRLAEHFASRWNIGLGRIRRRLGRVDPVLRGRFGGEGAELRGGPPPRPRLPWNYPSNVR